MLAPHYICRACRAYDSHYNAACGAGACSRCVHYTLSTRCKRCRAGPLDHHDAQLCGTCSLRWRRCRQCRGKIGAGATEARKVVAVLKYDLEPILGAHLIAAHAMPQGWPPSAHELTLRHMIEAWRRYARDLAMQTRRQVLADARSVRDSWDWVDPRADGAPLARCE